MSGRKSFAVDIFLEFDDAFLEIFQLSKESFTFFMLGIIMETLFGMRESGDRFVQSKIVK